MPDGTRTRNIQIRGLMHYPLCDELLYQLSYMAGERSLIEETTTHTTLQHALQIKSCPSLKCLCKESRCYAHLHNCKYFFSASLIGVLVWSVSYEIRMRQSSRYCSIGGLIALLNLVRSMTNKYYRTFGYRRSHEKYRSRISPWRRRQTALGCR